MSKTDKIHTRFSETYKTQCKTAWYSAGRIKITDLEKVVPEDEFGRKPKAVTLTSWRNDYSWDAWADDLDAQSEQVVEDELVNHRIKMLKDQAARGLQLQRKGMEYLEETGFDTSSSAVAAIKLGVDVERTSRGISDRLMKLAALSDEKLADEAQRLLEIGSESGEIIDVAEVDEEEVEDDAEVQ